MVESVSKSERGRGPFVTGRELAERWACARSSVKRIAERAGLSRFYLGEGRNGIVRYLRKEIEEFELSRKMTG